MLTPNQPAYIPIVLPNDAATLERMPPQAALMISAVYGANPRLGGLVRNAREHATTLQRFSYCNRPWRRICK